MTYLKMVEKISDEIGLRILFHDLNVVKPFEIEADAGFFFVDKSH